MGWVAWSPRLKIQLDLVHLMRVCDCYSPRTRSIRTSLFASVSSLNRHGLRRRPLCLVNVDRQISQNRRLE